MSRRLTCPHATRARSCCDDCRIRRRRDYQRRHARRRRERALVEKMRTARRCPRGTGGGVCGGPIETIIDRTLGRTIVRCAWCERRKRGICRDCPAPVAGAVGRALRCAVHTELAHKAQVRASHERHADENRARARARYQNDPEKRARNAEYKRAWRKANPEKVRKQKRRQALRQPKRIKTYMARYRAKHREHYREIALRRYRELHPPPQPAPCTECGTPVPYEPPGAPYKTCDRCCWPYQLRAREAKRAKVAAAKAAADDAAEAAFIARGRQPQPKPARRPRRPARTTPAGERLCVTPTCETVVRGREKKCARCRTADRDVAQAALERRRGRGRRTDLETAA